MIRLKIKWLSGAVVRFGRHLRTQNFHPPLSETGPTGIHHLPPSPRLFAAPTSLQSAHLSPSTLQKWPRPFCSAWILAQVASQSKLTDGTSQLFSKNSNIFCEKPFLDCFWNVHHLLRLRPEHWQVKLGSSCFSFLAKNDDAAPPFKALRAQSSFYHKSLECYCQWLTLSGVEHHHPPTNHT